MENLRCIMKNYLIFLALCLIFLLQSCSLYKSGKEVKIAIHSPTNQISVNNFAEWLKKEESEIEIVELKNYEENAATEVIAGVDGVIFVDNDSYMNYDTNLYDEIKLQEIENAQKFSTNILSIAIEKNLPILAIKSNIPIMKHFSKVNQNIYLNKTDSTDEKWLVFKKSSYLATNTKLDLVLMKTDKSFHFNDIANEFESNIIDESDNVYAYSYLNHKTKPYFLSVNWDPAIDENKSTLSKYIFLSFVKSSIDYYDRKQPKKLSSNQYYML